MSDATSPIDPAIAARLAELEATVVAQQVALEAERAARRDAEADRDRLRAAYQALQLEVELARRRLVVAKAERVDTTQLELEFASKLAALDKLAGLVAADDPGPAGSSGGEGSPSGAPADAGARGKGGRRDLRAMPIGEERVELPDPALEGKVERMGFEESVEVVWRRGGFVRLVVARVKYKTEDMSTDAPTTSALPDDVGETAAPAATAATGAGTAPMALIVTAPMPPRILPRSYATPSLAAHIMNLKFGFGMPFHRQEDEYRQLGVPIRRATMCRWAEELGAVAGATVVEAMRTEALATAFCIATDATGVRVLPDRRPDKKRQSCRRAHFFVQIADADHVFFEYSPVENGQFVSALFRGFSGYVQADAKSVFDILFRPPDQRERVDDDPPDRALRREVGCWSHARRGLWETAVATQDVIAREGLARIMRMFQLERLLKDRSPDERRELRDRYLRTHVESFFAFVEEEYERVKHQRGMLRSALGYCVRQKDALRRFLDDGRLAMTNNHSERQLRRIATGRNAWLFVGSDDHGQATGNLLTLIASARLHRLDSEAYLRDLFRVLPHWPRDRYLELAPRYWRITRARLDREQLAAELGPLTIPEPPLPTAVPASVPAEVRVAL